MAGISNKERTARKISAAVTKKRPEIIKKLEEVFAIDGTIEEACYYADISPVTYHNWVNADAELLNRFNALRNRPVLKARQTIVKALDNPDHAFRYVERKRRREFGANVDVTTDGQALPTPIIPLNAIPRNDSNPQDSGADKKD